MSFPIKKAIFVFPQEEKADGPARLHRLRISYVNQPKLNVMKIDKQTFATTVECLIVLIKRKKIQTTFLNTPRPGLRNKARFKV